MLFSDLDLNEDLLDALYDMRFEECTPIQEQCIPHILGERDVIGIAQTGTGKTAAYLLPLLTLLRSKPHPEDAVNCLIMAPTRELAKQIDQALQGFGYYMDINGVAVYGGNDGARYEQEKKSLSCGADIVIATPGRLITHLNLGTLDLSRTTHLVLDEADRMLDMGFYDDIMQVVNLLPPTRQTILFSATMPANIKKLTQSILTDPVEVKLAISKPADKIRQSVTICYERQKLPILERVFGGSGECPKTVLFSSSKQKVKEVARMLLKKGYRVGEMHSDLDQSQRDEVMRQYKNGHLDILVATDIVSRGIDIDDIELVVNFDVPHDAEDYVHRIGRTARADRDGAAMTFVGEKEQPKWAAIERFLGREIDRNQVPAELGAAPEYDPAAGKGRGGRGGRSGKPAAGRGGGRKKQNAPRRTDKPAAEAAVREGAPEKGDSARRRAHGRRRGRGKQPKNTGSTE